MSYFEIFILINLGWGAISLTSVLLAEKNGRYVKPIVISFIVLSWLYLLCCVPLFKDGIQPPETLALYYTVVAGILSIEVWLVMIVTLLTISLAKKTHNPEFKSYLLPFYQPIRKVFKPLWLIVALTNIINSGVSLTYIMN
ncbi:hypothetical protein MHM98_04375 [Psychrobium sp. MM17-31]|uniref:hypothetical protein n=1 Tax=Psychrobium sp. MM17-31 TaxID=2917758 RepID=UPI001EF5AE34|nr:hypothetical protein [Psychrobium sp. MM17-31]MCG7530594.1 hypothetical protein [Psychrobium sp. MM17-31]